MNNQLIKSLKSLSLDKPFEKWFLNNNPHFKRTFIFHLHYNPFSPQTEKYCSNISILIYNAEADAFIKI